MDPGLINGATLRRAGRSTALDFRDAHSAKPGGIVQLLPGRLAMRTFYVLPRSVGDEPLHASEAEDLTRAIGGDLAGAEEALRNLRVLRAAATSDVAPVLSLARYRHVFETTAVVLVLDHANVRCTCDAFMHHGQCEHIVFCSSLPGWATGPRTSLADLPRHRRTGRPAGSAKASGAHAAKRPRTAQ